MKNRKVFLVTSSILVVSVSAAAQNYGKAMSKAYQKVFDITKADGPYRWYGYPISNFGVLTAYDPAPGQPPIDSTRICGSWTCIGVTQEQAAKITGDAALDFNGYADLAEGGGFSLKASQSRSLVISLILPALAKLVNANGDINWSKEVDTDITVGKAYRRSVNRDKYATAIQGSSNNLLKNDYGAGRLTYVAADIVISDVKTTLTVKSSTSVGAKAALSNAVSAFGSGSSLDVSFKDNGNGSYTMTIPFPVVIATQMRKQPQAGQMSAKLVPDVLVDEAAPPARVDSQWRSK